MIKNYNNYLNENNKSDDDLIQECFIDFLSNDWIYRKVSDYFVKNTGYNFTYRKTYRTGKINKIDYAGKVENEKLDIIEKKFKTGGGDNDIKESVFLNFIDDLNVAVLRFNQMTGKDIEFVFTSNETTSIVFLVIHINID